MITNARPIIDLFHYSIVTAVWILFSSILPFVRPIMKNSKRKLIELDKTKLVLYIYKTKLSIFVFNNYHFWCTPSKNLINVSLISVRFIPIWRISRSTKKKKKKKKEGKRDPNSKVRKNNKRRRCRLNFRRKKSGTIFQLGCTSVGTKFFSPANRNSR